MIKKLAKLEKESLERGIPIIGKEKGAWLLEKIKEYKPKRILELGTANGYSGCILGSEEGELTTIEIDPFIVEEARKNFEKFRINANIIVGDGIQEVKRFSGDRKFDLIFIDFAKSKYAEVLDDCIRLLRRGGIIIADDVNYEKCKEYKEKILNYPYLETEIVDIGNGLSFSKIVF